MNTGQNQNYRAMAEALTFYMTAVTQTCPSAPITTPVHKAHYANKSLCPPEVDKLGFHNANDANSTLEWI